MNLSFHELLRTRRGKFAGLAFATGDASGCGSRLGREVAAGGGLKRWEKWEVGKARTRGCRQTSGCC
jgi:hypothetical protein